MRTDSTGEIANTWREIAISPKIVSSIQIEKSFQNNEKKNSQHFITKDSSGKKVKKTRS